jgi:thiol:disulfide interchange protein
VKKYILVFFLSNMVLFLSAQDMEKFDLYKPRENASVELNKAVKLAGEQGKHVFVQIGGNWCVWCARFHEYVSMDKQIDSLIKADYIVYHLNYSSDNRNPEILARFGYPQRFGFPVFIILNGKGEELHIQNSEYLEQGKSYNKSKVMEFLEQWSPAALDPARYKNF